MPISKNIWIAVGVFLWGMPTGLSVSMFFAMLPGALSEARGFEAAVWLKNLWLIPVFSLAGVFLGLTMHRRGLQAMGKEGL